MDNLHICDSFSPYCSECGVYGDKVPMPFG